MPVPRALRAAQDGGIRCGSLRPSCDWKPLDESIQFFAGDPVVITLQIDDFQRRTVSAKRSRAGGFFQIALLSHAGHYDSYDFSRLLRPETILKPVQSSYNRPHCAPCSSRSPSNRRWRQLRSVSATERRLLPGEKGHPFRHQIIEWLSARLQTAPASRPQDV